MISTRKSTSLPRLLPQTQRSQKPRSLSPNGRNKLTGDRFPVLPDLKKEQNTSTQKNQEKKNQEIKKNALDRISFYPRLDEPHPYPYIISPDVVLLHNSDDEKPPEKVKEDIVERFILDTPFAKGFIDEIIFQFLEHELRTVALSFTNRQGPANKLSPDKQISGALLTSQLPINTDLPIKSTKTNDREKEAAHSASLAEDIIATEVIQSLLLTLLGNAMDVRAIYLEDDLYKDIISNDRGYAISDKAREDLQKHVNEVGKAVRANKSINDYTKFKDMQTKKFIYHFHTMWQEFMSEENYALRQSQLKFINEAAWEYFSKEIWQSVETSMNQLDDQEMLARNKGSTQSTAIVEEPKVR